jgi:hypothetical protein
MLREGAAVGTDSGSRLRLGPVRVGARDDAATGRERKSLSSVHTRRTIRDGGGCGAGARGARGSAACTCCRLHTEREHATTASCFTASRQRRWHPASRGGRNGWRSASGVESKGPGRSSPRANSPAAASPFAAAKGNSRGGRTQGCQAGQRFPCASGAHDSYPIRDRGWIGHC